MVLLDFLQFLGNLSNVMLVSKESIANSPFMIHIPEHIENLNSFIQIYVSQCYVPSENGNKYMMIIIDDYTRMCWVYLLKKKSDDFQTFKNFHAWIQNDAQTHIVSLRTDNGKEYTSNEFENYLRQHGIKN